MLVSLFHPFVLSSAVLALPVHLYHLIDSAYFLEKKDKILQTRTVFRVKIRILTSTHFSWNEN